MTEISADVMKTATEIVDRIAKSHVWKGDCVADVAGAILAERERCAEIFRWFRTESVLMVLDHHTNEVAKAALEKIESGEPITASRTLETYEEFKARKR